MAFPTTIPSSRTTNFTASAPTVRPRCWWKRSIQGYRDKGMCIPIIRPKSFVGPERLGVFALFYDWAKDGKSFPYSAAATNRYQLLDVEDLCDAIYLTATLPCDRVNDVFNIGAKEFTTLKEDYQAVLDYAGFGKEIVSIPASPAIWTLRAGKGQPLAPLMGLRDGDRGFVCVD
ncbi:MAG: hypothetical protein R3A10_00590 [Caldilineaceae bacterium]